MNTPERTPNDQTDNVLPAETSVATASEYEAFGLWMNVQLSQLVARWKHLAAPKAAHAEFAHSRRFSAPRKAK